MSKEFRERMARKRAIQPVGVVPEIGTIVSAFYVEPTGKNGRLSEYQVQTLCRQFNLTSYDDVAKLKTRIMVHKLSEDQIANAITKTRKGEKAEDLSSAENLSMEQIKDAKEILLAVLKNLTQIGDEIKAREEQEESSVDTETEAGDEENKDEGNKEENGEEFPLLVDDEFTQLCHKYLGDDADGADVEALHERFNALPEEAQEEFLWDLEKEMRQSQLAEVNLVEHAAESPQKPGHEEVMAQAEMKIHKAMEQHKENKKAERKANMARALDVLEQKNQTGVLGLWSQVKITAGAVWDTVKSIANQAWGLLNRTETSVETARPVTPVTETAQAPNAFYGTSGEHGESKTMPVHMAEVLSLHLVNKDKQALYELLKAKDFGEGKLEIKNVADFLHASVAQDIFGESPTPRVLLDFQNELFKAFEQSRELILSSSSPLSAKIKVDLAQEQFRVFSNLSKVITKLEKNPSQVLGEASVAKGMNMDSQDNPKPHR